jgi:hypothetical protein
MPSSRGGIVGACSPVGSRGRLRGSYLPWERLRSGHDPGDVRVLTRAIRRARLARSGALGTPQRLQALMLLACRLLLAFHERWAGLANGLLLS